MTHMSKNEVAPFSKTINQLDEMEQSRLRVIREIQTAYQTSQQHLKEILAESHLFFLKIAQSAHPSVILKEQPAIKDKILNAENGVLRLGIGMVEAPCSGFTYEGLFDAPFYIIEDHLGIAPLLSEKLAYYNIQSEIVTQLPAEARHVLYLAGINEISTPEEAIAMNSTCFESIKELAGHFADGSAGIFITVQNTGGDFGLSGQEDIRAWSAGISALAKTAATEWPAVKIKSIDIACQAFSLEEIADYLAQEILFGGDEQEVCLLSDGRRGYIEVAAKFLQEEEEFLPTEGDVWVITGGARGVTAHCLIKLSKKVKLKMALLGRTALLEEPDYLAGALTDADIKKAILDHALSLNQKIHPQELKKEAQAILANREVRETLEAIRANQCLVDYYPTDVNNLVKLEETLNQIRQQWGPIKGVVHAAGILADKKIHQKTVEQFKQVFETKVIGFYNLLHATRSDPLTHLCCFTSVVAKFGNAGQVDYAMGNEVLNKVCQTEWIKRNKTSLIKAINWGPWEGGMVKPELKAHFASKGLFLIPIEQGADIFVQELSYKGSNIEVVIGQTLNPGIQLDRSFDLRVDEISYPFILDHQIRYIPVIPLVLVNEWFIKAVDRSYHVEKSALTSHHLTVINGIKLQQIEQGAIFTLKIKRDSDQTFSCSLWEKGEKLKKCYEAIVGAEDFILPDFLARLDPSQLQPWDRSKEQAYEVLFHGPELQVIHHLDRLSVEGGIGFLEQPRPLLGSMGNTLTPLAILDGGLQLAVLWIWEQTRKHALPIGFSSFALKRSFPEIGSLIKCEFRCTSCQAFKAQADIVFMDEQEEPFAFFTGVNLALLEHSSKTGLKEG